MNRKYDTARYLESVSLLRAWFQDPAVTTDLIVGFPGETEAEFRQTLDFIRTCRFSAMHIFPYSIRPGTPAAAMEQVDGPVKEERAHRAGELARGMKTEFLAARVGRTVEVLFEEERDGRWYGHTPDYLLLRAAGDDLHNRLCPVRVDGVEDGVLTGTLALAPEDKIV
jgi:threonylcarbamoyladenosine tRNA methylthiotransferase MtaB